MQINYTKYWGRSRLTLLAIAVISLLTTGIVSVMATAPTGRAVSAHARPASPKLTPQPVASMALAAQPQAFEPLAPEQAAAINARTPISRLPNPAAAPFRLTDANPRDRANALTCLTMAVYYEAGTQPQEGQEAVAQVVLNRVRNPHFPKSICGVVFEGSELPTGCQFTFTCDGSLNRAPSPDLWRAAREVARRALDGYVQTQVGLATHYHTIWVVPYWQTSVIKVGHIGAHDFFRMEGGLGAPDAFTGQYAGAELIRVRLSPVEQEISPPAQRIEVLAPASPTTATAGAAGGSAADKAPQPIILATARTASAPTLVAMIPPAPTEKPSYFSRGYQTTQRLPTVSRW